MRERRGGNGKARNKGPAVKSKLSPDERQMRERQIKFAREHDFVPFFPQSKSTARCDGKTTTLWKKDDEHSFTPEGIFEMQNNICRMISFTVPDQKRGGVGTTFRVGDFVRLDRKTCVKLTDIVHDCHLKHYRVRGTIYMAINGLARVPKTVAPTDPALCERMLVETNDVRMWHNYKEMRGFEAIRVVPLARGQGAAVVLAGSGPETCCVMPGILGVVDNTDKDRNRKTQIVYKYVSVSDMSPNRLGAYRRENFFDRYPENKMFAHELARLHGDTHDGPTTTATTTSTRPPDESTGGVAEERIPGAETSSHTGTNPGPTLAAVVVEKGRRDPPVTQSGDTNRPKEPGSRSPTTDLATAVPVPVNPQATSIDHAQLRTKDSDREAEEVKKRDASRRPVSTSPRVPEHPPTRPRGPDTQDAARQKLQPQQQQPRPPPLLPTPSSATKQIDHQPRTATQTPPVTKTRESDPVVGPTDAVLTPPEPSQRRVGYNQSYTPRGSFWDGQSPVRETQRKGLDELLKARRTENIEFTPNGSSKKRRWNEEMGHRATNVARVLSSNSGTHRPQNGGDKQQQQHDTPTPVHTEEVPPPPPPPPIALLPPPPPLPSANVDVTINPDFSVIPRPDLTQSGNHEDVNGGSVTGSMVPTETFAQPTNSNDEQYSAETSPNPFPLGMSPLDMDIETLLRVTCGGGICPQSFGNLNTNYVARFESTGGRADTMAETGCGPLPLPTDTINSTTRTEVTPISQIVSTTETTGQPNAPLQSIVDVQKPGDRAVVVAAAIETIQTPPPVFASTNMQPMFEHQIDASTYPGYRVEAVTEAVSTTATNALPKTATPPDKDKTTNTEPRQGGSCTRDQSSSTETRERSDGPRTVAVIPPETAEYHQTETRTLTATEAPISGPAQNNRKRIVCVGNDSKAEKMHKRRRLNDGHLLMTIKTPIDVFKLMLGENYLDPTTVDLLQKGLTSMKAIRKHINNSGYRVEAFFDKHSS